MDWQFILWLALLGFAGFVWISVLGTMVRVMSVEEAGVWIRGRLSGQRFIAWDKIRGPARKFATLSVGGGRRRIDVRFTPHSFFSFRSTFSARIEDTPQFREFERELARRVPVVDVKNLPDLFRRS